MSDPLGTAVCPQIRRVRSKPTGTHRICWSGNTSCRRRLTTTVVLLLCSLINLIVGA